jgi:hypothetical protein
MALRYTEGAMKKRVWIAFALILSLSPLGLRAEPGADTERVEKKLEWEAVDGASAYLVELRDSGGAYIFSDTLRGTYVTLSLSEGRYELRVTALNKFLKAASSSPWKSFSVLRTGLPLVSSLAPASAYAGQASADFRAEGDFFLPAMRVYLKLAKGKREASIGKVEGGSVEFNLRLDDLAPGDYSLVFANPGDSPLEREVRLKLLARVKPTLNSIVPNVFYNDRVYAGVELSGSGFEPGLSLSFVSADGTQTFAAEGVELVSPQKIRATWNPGLLAPGEWFAVLRNPGGLEARLPVKLETPPPLELEPAKTVVKIERVPMGVGGALSVLVGYPFVFGVGDYADLFGVGYESVSIALQAEVGNGLLGQIPLLRDSAIEFGASYNEYGARDDLAVSTTLRCLRLDLTGVIRTRRNSPLQFSARAGMGTTFDWCSISSYYTSDPVLDFTEDFAVNLGLSAFWETKSGFTVELLAEYSPLFFAEQTFHTVRISLRTGWRFVPAAATTPSGP